MLKYLEPSVKQKAIILASSTLGFSIVEAVIMAALLSIGAIASITLFAFTAQQQKRASDAQKIQEAIAADVADIERFNERIVCSGENGLCSVDSGASIPSEAEFSHADYLPNATVNLFRDRCNGIGNETLGAVAATLLASAVPVPSNFSSLGISRSAPVAEATPNGEPPSHRYMITWTHNGMRARQLVLVPRVAAWCP